MRRVNLSINLFEFSMNGSYSDWKIAILSITKNYYTRSLFRLEWRLPNMTTVRRFTLDHWDFLFLQRPLWKAYDNLSDRKLWNHNSLGTVDEMKLKILSKLFK